MNLPYISHFKNKLIEVLDFERILELKNLFPKLQIEGLIQNDRILKNSQNWQSKLPKKTMFALFSLSLYPVTWNFRFSKPTSYQVVEDYFFTGSKPGRAGVEICLRPPKWEIFR
jgi:hypothetical protein